MLERMVKAGGRLQWHTWSHDVLRGSQPQQTYERELTVPDRLRTLCPEGFKWLAYPHGRCDDSLKEQARNYFQGAVCDTGNNHDRYDLRRITVLEKTRFSPSTVSVIIPCYNYGHFAAEAIESVIHQTYPPDEILFIDDASFDDSVSVAKRYLPRIRIEVNPNNLGIVDNFNKAVSLTTGDYICFLGADNRFRSDYIEKAKKILDCNPDVGIVYTNLVMWDKRAPIVAVDWGAKPHPKIPGFFLKDFPAYPQHDIREGNYIHGSSMYRRKAFEQAGGYIKGHLPEDNSLWIRILEAGWKARLLDEYVLEYRQHSKDQTNILKGFEMANVHLRTEVQNLRTEVQKLQNQLAALAGTSEDEALLRLLWRIRFGLAPRGSFQDRILRLGIKGLRFWKREGFRAFLQKVVQKTGQRLFILLYPLWHPLKSAVILIRRKDCHLPSDAERFYESLIIFPNVPKRDLPAILNRQLLAKPLRRPDVICFSIIDWSFRYQRPQQIMSQFSAQGHRVFYISLSHFHAATSRSKVSVRGIKENIYEISLTAQRRFDIYAEVIEGKDAELMLSSLDELRLAYQIEEAIGYVMISSWTNVALEAQKRWGWRIIYDCVDEWEDFPLIKRPLLERERHLVQECDLLIVTAQRLYKKWEKYNRPMVIARNAVDYQFFAERCLPNEILTKIRHPVIGYYGAIADWFDTELITYIATQRPDYTFVLIGGVFNIDVSTLKILPNIRLLGQQPYETMPKYLYHFDVCIIPFKINPITRATDPVKLYEYLSAGKPVVSVALPELEPYKEFLYIAKDRNDFLTMLDRAVTENNHDLITRRKAFAQQHTWEDRYRRIEAGLRNVIPRASIIVVTYNNLAFTKLCLESIIQNTEYPNYEVIVVDNNSTDDTQAYLQSISNQYTNFTVILNQQNNGFAKANNQGIARATGKYLILLNNDTIVPPGWLSRLIRHLDNPEIGLVGPVTNFAGNEAKIKVSYQTMGEMESFAKKYTWNHVGQFFDIPMLAMFCIGFRRDVLEKVGPLDEQFEVGMFEDDDYAQRVRLQGYRVVCAEDVFVHHFGQTTFGELIQTGEYDKIFEKNRRRFEAKWGIRWKQHQPRQ